ncbi:DUF2690 domain-containing protein [Kitasatospora sp. NPDC127116]|uniref:DUF2690 domain-containing protein n=1 Tax=Kitasatospora sp. NPDC127116 TaxID=3345367 RepID=UPI003637CEF5
MTHSRPPQEAEEPDRQTAAAARAELARTLRRWRQDAGNPTQVTVSRRTAIAQTTLSRYENPDGRYPAPEAALRSLAAYYAVADGELVRALELRAAIDGGADDSPVPEPVPEPAAATAPGAPLPGSGPTAGQEPGGERRHRALWATGGAAVAAACAILYFAAGPGIGAGDISGTDAASTPARQAVPAPTAAFSCDGASCLHVDPVGTVCDRDAATAAADRDFGVLIELRYSPSCHAAWAKMSGGSPGDRVQVFGTPPEQEEYRQQSGHDAHSKMVRAARPADARACAVVDDRGTVCAALPETPAG